MMQIETGRLIIRPFKPEDEAELIEMASDGTLNDIFGDCAGCESWMGRWIEEARGLCAKDDPCGEYLAYAVEEKESGQLVGSVGCSRFSDLQETGITYFIGSRFRGNGYAAEAARAYAGYFLSRYDLSHLIAAVREENAASWRASERAGFLLRDKRMYRDLNDDKEELYRFYSAARDSDAESLLK